MIVESQAPCRISLFGGGTDLPEYANRYGGLVISFAINLRQKLKLYTADNLFDITRNEIPYKGDLNFLHTIFEQFKTGNKFGGFHDVRFISQSDALLNSGLGASAAAAVTTIAAMNKVHQLNLSKAQIAEMAWEIEVTKIGLYGGRQDQYISSFGGFNAITFEKNKIEVNPLRPEMIEQIYPGLVLIHTGFTRENPKIQEGFKKLSTEQIAKLSQLKEIAVGAFVELESGDIEGVGQLLDQSWESKKQSNKGVNNPEIDEIYDKAKKLGAYGGKTLGAGGGGYMLFVVDPEKKEKFIEELGVDWCDFSIDWNGVESRIL